MAAIEPIDHPLFSSASTGEPDVGSTGDIAVPPPPTYERYADFVNGVFVGWGWVQVD